MTKIGKKGYWVKSSYISQSNTGYWSKWGGGRYSGDHENLAQWACQGCGETQYDILPSFLVDIGSNEYVRVCALCRYIYLRHSLETFEQLIQRVRKPDMLALIANLATLPLRF